MKLPGQPIRRIREAMTQPGAAEGLATGIGASWLMGPVGLLLGAGQGILANRMHKSELEETAKYHARLEELDKQLNESVLNALEHAETDIDREQFAQQLDHIARVKGAVAGLPADQRGVGLMAFAQLDPTGAALEDIESAVERTEDSQRQAYVGHAQYLRAQGKQTYENYRNLQSNMEQAHALLSDPEVDVNNPLIRGSLASYLELGARQVLADPEGFGDALTAAGGSALVGPIFAMIGGFVEAEDFNWSREDWGKVFRALDSAHRDQYETEIIGLQTEAGRLEEAGGGWLGEYGLDDIAMLGMFSGPQNLDSPLSDDYGGVAPGPDREPTRPTTRAELEQQAAQASATIEQTIVPVGEFTDLPSGLRARVELAESELGPLSFDGRSVIDQNGRPVPFGAGELAAFNRRYRRRMQRARGALQSLERARRLLPQTLESNAQ